MCWLSFIDELLVLNIFKETESDIDIEKDDSSGFDDLYLLKTMIIILKSAKCSLRETTK